jgi:hypothetical protein
MLNFIDSMDDLEFLTIFVAALAAIYLIEWATDYMGRGKR